MKVMCPAFLYGMNTGRDQAVRFKVETPELPPSEVAMIYQLSGKQGWFLFSEKEMSESDLPTTQPPKLASGKTQSQLLRAVLYKIWEIESRGFDEFNKYY